MAQTPDGRPPAEQPRWRQDFPTDTPEDEALARREFTKFLVLTSGAFVAGQGWIGLMSLLREEKPLPAKAIAAEGEVPPGGVVEFRYPTEDDPCLLVRLHDGRLVAYGQQCSHLSCAVIPEPEQRQLRCPCHNGFFEIHEGRPPARRGGRCRASGWRCGTGSFTRPGWSCARYETSTDALAEGDHFQRHQPDRHAAGAAAAVAAHGDDERLAGRGLVGRLAGGAGQLRLLAG
jgi:nitrite reductase/ring-hydroxylating ferredoxin subunit